MNNNTVPIRPGLFKQDPEPCLVGSKCPRCNSRFFPAREVCSQCYLVGLDDYSLGRRGSVQVFTTVYAPIPDFPSPYVVGYVHIPEDGLSVPTLLTAEKLEDIAVGMSANLVVEPLSATSKGETVLVYKFQVGEGVL